MKNNQYYYAVTRVHNNETGLLSAQAVEQMLQADSLAGCLGVLREHGWAADDSMRVQEIIEAQQEKTWAFLDEITGETDILRLFRYEHDFGNVKAVIKLRYVNRADDFGKRYISKFGTLPQQMLKDFIASGNLNLLQEPFFTPASEASRILLQTGNVQLADSILDKACLEAVHAEAESCGSAVLKQYADMKADIANIKIAVRGLKMNNSGDFFSLALTELGSLSKKELCAAVAKGPDALNAYIGSTAYADCLSALEESLSFFQTKVESRLIDAIKPQKHAIGGADPIFAFVIAKENELNVVRLLLSSKINHFPKAFVTGCLRRMYA